MLILIDVLHQFTYRFMNDMERKGHEKVNHELGKYT